MNENKPTVETEPQAATADNKKKTIFLAPPSQRGKKGTVGAPAKPIIGLTKSPCRGRFTLKDIHALNGGTVSMLTIINCLNGTDTRKGLLESGEAVKLDEKAKVKGKPGKPADIFILAKYAEKKKAAKTKAIKTVTVETAPVVNANPEPAPAPEPEPVHAEAVL